MIRIVYYLYVLYVLLFIYGTNAYCSDPKGCTICNELIAYKSGLVGFTTSKISNPSSDINNFMKSIFLNVTHKDFLGRDDLYKKGKIKFGNSDEYQKQATFSDVSIGTYDHLTIVAQKKEKPDCVVLKNVAYKDNFKVYFSMVYEYTKESKQVKVTLIDCMTNSPDDRFCKRDLISQLFKQLNYAGCRLIHKKGYPCRKPEYSILYFPGIESNIYG